MSTWMKLLLPSVLLASSMAHAATRNPPALGMKAPSLKAQITANAMQAGVWQRVDSPTLRVKRAGMKAVATITGLVHGGARGGSAKFRDPMRRASFDVKVSPNGEIAKRKGAWKDIQIHRM